MNKPNGSKKSVRATPRASLKKNTQASSKSSAKASKTSSKQTATIKRSSGNKKLPMNALPSSSFYPFGIEKHGDLEWQFDRFSKLIKKFDAKDVDRLMKAYRYAEEKHKNQMRADGSSYIIHPLRIANTLMGEWSEKDPDVIVAGLLHDVIEDTQTTIREVKDAFGDVAAKLIDGMTMWKGSESHDVYLQRISRGPEKLRLIKCADSLDNLRSWHECPKKDAVKFPRWWRQTKDYVLPIAKSTYAPAAKLINEIVEDPWYLKQAQMA